MNRLLRCFISLLLVVSTKGICNTAQPGIFEAGGTGNFILMFPEDSSSFRKMQMVYERITIQLYKGYGVVKGEYKMYNTTDSIVSIKVGYPVNAFFKATEHSVATHIFFDKLYALKSYTNGRENPLIIKPGPERQSMDANNWYVWDNSFKPKDTTIITVYFIVNTNNTIIREGYAVDKNNGFIYLLETGATWKQPIVRGEIKIGLMDNIKTRNIHGLSPDYVFKINNERNTLYYTFNNLSPTFEDNIVLVYTPDMEQFDFGNIISKKETLFSSVDSFSKQPIEESKFSNHHFKDPYKISSVFNNIFLLLAAIIGGFIIVLIVIIKLFKSLIRYIRK